MYITGLMTFVMFPLASAIGNHKMEKLVPFMLKIVVIPYTVFLVWVLWHYLHLHTVVFPSGNLLLMNGEFSLEIGGNRNHAGADGLTVLALCLYLAAAQKSWRKLPYCFCALVCYAVLVYSNCSTSWYACLLLGAAAAFLSVSSRLGKMKAVLRFSAGLLAAAIVVFLLYWTRNSLFSLPACVLRQSGILFDPGAAARTFETGLSGRGPLYRACLYVLSHNRYAFLFGVTPSDIGLVTHGMYGIEDIYPHAHNIFLQMGMSYGVPFMLLTVAFCISLAIRSLRILRYGDRLSPGARMIPVVVLCMLAQDMTEAYLNSGGTMAVVAFYLFAGWIVELDRMYMWTIATTLSGSGSSSKGDLVKA